MCFTYGRTRANSDVASKPTQRIEAMPIVDDTLDEYGSSNRYTNKEEQQAVLNGGRKHVCHSNNAAR
jgi:hypothetical protein